MSAICASCSRRLLARRTIASTSHLQRFPRPRTFSTFLLPPPTYRPTRFTASFSRSATTSSVNTSHSGAPSMPLIPPRPNIKVIAPSLEAIKQEGYFDDDVKLLRPEECILNITPEAIQQLSRITSREPLEVLQKGKLALRVGVESGGCHGYQYTMDLSEERNVDDYILQPEGISCIPVVVDLTSFGLLKGATLHHATELIGSSFRLQDNPQAKEGGACGCGVSWEAR